MRKESGISLCDSYCEPCVYSRVNDQFGLTTCNYINVVGVSRGCPAGKGCGKRVIGEKKRTIESFIYRGRRDDGRPVNCPNCGAVLKSGTCEYCGSVLEVE